MEIRNKLTVTRGEEGVEQWGKEEGSSKGRVKRTHGQRQWGGIDCGSG